MLSNIFKEQSAESNYSSFGSFACIKMFLPNLFFLFFSFLIVLHPYMRRADGLQNCLELPLPSRTAQVSICISYFFLFHYFGRLTYTRWLQTPNLLLSLLTNSEERARTEKLVAIYYCQTKISFLILNMHSCQEPQSGLQFGINFMNI
jgi:hypothetical protein